MAYALIVKDICEWVSNKRYLYLGGLSMSILVMLAAVVLMVIIISDTDDRGGGAFA